MTIFFSSSDLQIYRRRRKASSNRFAMSATLTVFEADIQPSQVERAQMFDGRYGAVYETYIDSSIDVREGDQMVDVDSNKRYSVKGVTDWSGAGILDHKEIILVAQDGNSA